VGQVQVHGLRHTFGQRLRDGGVREEDRALLLGRAIEGMPQHYATATVAQLVDAANGAALTRDRTTLLRVANDQEKEGRDEKSPKSRAKMTRTHAISDVSP
jgi:hypothetical protein